MHSDIKFLVYFSIVNQHFAATLSEEHFYLSTIVSFWNETENICYVGAPSFEFTSGKNVVNNDSLSDVNGKDVWVGYFEKMESFNYVGCLEKEFNRNGFEDFGSPGQCFRQCGYANYFGLMDMKCFCFQVNPWSVSNTSAMNPNCSSECTYQQGVACGGPGFLSVYTHAGHNQAKVHMQSSERSMSCLQVNQDRKQFSWANCNDSNAVACEFSGKYLLTASPSVKHSWIGTSTECFSSGALMLPFSNNLTSQEKNETVWTNVIRSPVIYHHTLYNEKAEYESGVIQYGFLTEENGEYIITFTEEHNSNRQVLCAGIIKEASVGPLLVVLVTVGILVVITVAVLWIKRRKNLHTKTATKMTSSLTERAFPACELRHSQHEAVTNQYVSVDLTAILDGPNDEQISNSKSQVCEHNNYYLLEKLAHGDKDKTTIVGGFWDGNVNNVKERNDQTTAKSTSSYDGIEITEKLYDKCYTNRGSSYDHICISGDKVTWKADKTYDTFDQVKVKVTSGDHVTDPHPIKSA